MTPTTRTFAKKRARARLHERGIALIMVLGATAVLGVMIAEFTENTRTESASAFAERNSVQAEYHAKSATSLARLLIASEPTIRKAIAPLFAFLKKTPPQLPVWEFSDRILGAFNDASGAKEFTSATNLDVTLGKNLGLSGGRFELVIIDEDSKINLNLGAANDIAHIRLAKQLMSKMQNPVLNPLFEQKDQQGNYHDRLTICSSILDWADVDEYRFNCDLASTAGPSTQVEDYAYYQLLPKPYRIKNAPFDSLEELHMVRGVGDDFWSTIVDPDPTDPRKRNFTVWGQGSVNVNSANAETLWALVCSGAPQAEICNDPTQMSMFIMGVTMAKGITMGAPLFGNAQDLINTMKGQGQLGPLLALMGMKPVKFQSESDFAKSITTESKVFSIYAVGVVEGMRRKHAKGAEGGKACWKAGGACAKVSSVCYRPELSAANDCAPEGYLCCLDKEETRTQIHTVVDFRSAPSLVGGGTFGSSGSSAGASSSRPNPAAPPPGTGTGVTDPNNGLANANQPSTGGQVLYYKME